MVEIPVQVPEQGINVRTFRQLTGLVGVEVAIGTFPLTPWKVYVEA
jgi:hypothetical protein